MRRTVTIVAAVGVLAAVVGFAGGLLVARSGWAVPCESELHRYARKCERRVMSCEAQAHVLWLARSAAAWAREHGKMPPSAPRTPPDVPRGELVETPVEIWEAPGWKAHRFRPRRRHRFSYELETTERTFAARAFGDLDGDGTTSLFERVGELDSSGRVDESAGLLIERELE